MLAEIFKRTLSLLIPTALIFFSIQYHETGKVTVLGITAYLIAFLLSGLVIFGLNVWWTRRFGTGKGSSIAKAVLWVIAVICLYLFFRHFDRG